MLRKMNNTESIMIKDDPVRPHFSYEWRTSSGREVWVWENPSTKQIDAVICVAYTNQIPTSETELEIYSNAAAAESTPGSTAVFYTVWSYAAGAGRTLVNELAAHLRTACDELERWVTLSPLTDMAYNFHTRNGAKLLQKNETTQNFDYTDQILSLFPKHKDLAARD